MNLGLSYLDIRDSVRVANTKCEVSEQDYEQSTKIVCYTRPTHSRQRQGQHVVIRQKDEEKYTAVSTQTFIYTNPGINLRYYC